MVVAHKDVLAVSSWSNSSYWLVLRSEHVKRKSGLGPNSVQRECGSSRNAARAPHCPSQPRSDVPSAMRVDSSAAKCADGYYLPLDL
jgi:hypothetical protein